MKKKVLKRRYTSLREDYSDLWNQYTRLSSMAVSLQDALNMLNIVQSSSEGDFDEAVEKDGKKTCSCHKCDPPVGFMSRMYTCKDCGNKRCPRAGDHELPCTGTNNSRINELVWEVIHEDRGETRCQCGNLEMPMHWSGSPCHYWVQKDSDRVCDMCKQHCQSDD